MKKVFFKCIIGFLIALVIFGVLQLFVANSLGDPDGYYHAAMAHTREQNVFPWLPYTTWGTQFADQHLLYHVLLWPFHNLSVLSLSVILFSSLFVMIFVIALFQLLKPKVASLQHWIYFWPFVLLFGSADFLFRINLVKANTLSLILLLSAVTIFLKRKSWPLLILSFIFVWTYGGFIFLPFVALALSLFASDFSKRFRLTALLAVIAGIALGVVLHPGFPNLITSLFYQVVGVAQALRAGVVVGNEWYPYGLRNFFLSNSLVFLFWIVAIWFVIKDRFKARLPLDGFSISLGMLSFFFFLLTLKSRRFVEYWVPFAILLSAYELTPRLARIKWQDVKDRFQQYWQFRVGSILVMLMIVGAATYNVKTVVGYLQSSQKSDAYKGASEWLVKNSKEGDIVFNAQWDQFPQLFYWNDKNYYIIGMDPTFMYEYDKNLYWKWRTISDDNPEVWTEDVVYQTMKDDFKSKFIFLETDRNPNLKKYLDSRGSTEFTETYRDDKTAVYKVKD